MNRRRLLLTLVLGLTALGAVALVLTLRLYRIPQNGMYPGLPAGSRVLVRRTPYADPSEVQRGDVVVFEQTRDRTRVTYVWRVVGLPGDTVEMTGAALTLNGTELSRVRIREDDGRIVYREANPPASYEVAYAKDASPAAPPVVSLTVPRDEFFLLGDNRSSAADSRSLGTIPFAAITGKVWWP